MSSAPLDQVNVDGGGQGNPEFASCGEILHGNNGRGMNLLMYFFFFFSQRNVYMDGPMVFVDELAWLGESSSNF